MTTFKYLSAAVWLIFCINVPTVIANFQFWASLTSGSNYSRPGSGISWIRTFNNPGSGPCDMQGTIRLPFSSGSCYRFALTFNSDPSGYNFHIDNGCGDGWGGTSGCYEMHNIGQGFVVYARTGSGDSTHLTNVIGTQTEVKVEKGKVEVESNGITQTVYNPTLFTSRYVYFSMNRVYNLNRYPYPLRVGTGLCQAIIFTC